MSDFPIDERSKANRYAERATYDKRTLTSILAVAPILHVSFNPPGSDSPFPSVLPMLAAHDPSTDSIYLHGSSVSRLIKLTSSSPEGLPMTLSATLNDGYVLALSPFSHSVNYRSAIIFGRAKMVTDEGEVLSAMELITNRLVPQRWGNSRVPPTKSEIKATGILRVEIETASCKVRKGAAHSERRDERDEGVRGKVWEGVVPVYEALGEPAPSVGNAVEEVPGYIGGWVQRENEGRSGYAEGAAVDD